MLPPLRKARVRLLPFRDRGAPVAEDRLHLRRRALAAWNGENVANVLGQRVRRCPGSLGDGEPKPPEVVILVVVAVPSSVILGEIKSQQGAARIRDGRRRQKNRFA